MFKRPLVMLALLGAAVGVPYVSSKSPGILEDAKRHWESSTGILSGDDSNGPSVAHASEVKRETVPIGSGRFQRITDVPLVGPPVHDLAEVLRMDVTTGWVYSRWSRKSTALPDLDLYGIRVPLMTGTRVDDLAGSLTYYFNPVGRVQRISFSGRTGDTRKLVTLMISKYGFRLQPAEISGEQLYQVKWNGKPISELRIRPASVLWSSAPHASFQVQLEFERPGSGRYVTRRG